MSAISFDLVPHEITAVMQYTQGVDKGWITRTPVGISTVVCNCGLLAQRVPNGRVAQIRADHLSAAKAGR